MPQTIIQVYRKANGDVPLLEWLAELEEREPRAHAKCLDLLLRLESLGYELRRPHADMLRDGIMELRARVGKVNYRMLYFFHGRNATIISHGITKEGKVPNIEIERALANKSFVERDPGIHLGEWSVSR